MEFHILGVATRKARAPNERLCRGTESKWLADERVDLAGLWYCKSSVMYGRWPVLRILWTTFYHCGDQLPSTCWRYHISSVHL